MINEIWYVYVHAKATEILLSEPCYQIVCTQHITCMYMIAIISIV